MDGVCVLRKLAQIDKQSTTAEIRGLKRPTAKLGKIMGRIQSSIGLVTGTDIAGTVDQLIAINAQPRDRLAARTELLQREQQALAGLTASVIGVQLSGNSLSSLSTFRSKDATSSDTESLSVQAGSGATAGNHIVRTIQTAATHSVASRQRFDSATEALGVTGSLAITPDGFLDQSIDVADLNNGRGVEPGSIRITDRGGNSAEVDLSQASTIDDVLQAINDADVDVFASTEGGKIKLTDRSGQSDSNLIVEQLGDAETAADLGLFGIDEASNSVTGFDLTFNVSASTQLSDLRENRGIRFADGDDLTINLSDGTSLDVDFGDFGGVGEPTIQDVLDQLNALDPAKLSAAYTSEGIEVTDLSGGTESFSIADAEGSNAASDLRLTGSTSTDTIIARYDPQVLRGTALEELAGGSGISGLTTLDITTSDGTNASIDLSSATTTAEVVDAINDSGLDVLARLNEAGTGLRLRDVSGGTGNFLISSTDDTANQLGIAADTQDDIVVGESLNRQTVDERTLLSDLNNGLGVSQGSFTITDSDGGVSAINTSTQGIATVGELVEAINSLSINVTASLNEAGDGIAIVDNAGGSGTLSIADTGNNTTAAELGIAGEATDQSIGGATVSALVGSQSDRIEIEATDSLASIVEKINASERYATASVRANDDGTFSLNVRSNKGGQAGQFGIDTSGFDLDLDTASQAQDALIGVSSDGGNERVLSSSDGVFEIDASGSSDSTVTAFTSLETLSSTANSGSFTITDSAGTTSAINLTVENITTVGELVDAINNLGIGVTASINEDSTGISIIDTAGGDETLTIEDVGNGIAASSLGIAGEATEQTVNGLTVSALEGTGQSSSDESATGLTFTLKELSVDPINVSVTEDASAVTSAVNTFVTQFNNLAESLQSLTLFNADTNEVGLLFGSSEAARIRNGYSRLLSGVVGGAGNIRSIGQVGIRFNDQGQLEVDEAKLADAIEDSRTDVEAFFTTEDSGLADRLSELADSIAGAESSLLINRTETLGAQVLRNNQQIETLNERLEVQRERLTLQFFQTEEAISRLQSNSSAIDSIQRITIPT